MGSLLSASLAARKKCPSISALCNRTADFGLVASRPAACISERIGYSYGCRIHPRAAGNLLAGPKTVIWEVETWFRLVDRGSARRSPVLRCVRPRAPLGRRRPFAALLRRCQDRTEEEPVTRHRRGANAICSALQAIGGEWGTEELLFALRPPWPAAESVWKAGSRNSKNPSSPSRSLGVARITILGAIPSCEPKPAASGRG